MGVEPPGNESVFKESPFIERMIAALSGRRSSVVLREVALMVLDLGIGLPLRWR